MLDSSNGERLGALAQAQHGVFTRRQALEVGFAMGAIDHRVHVADWVAVDHGIYRAAGTPESWRQRLMAACLVGPAVASHRSAAALWHLPGYGENLVEVTALRHRRRKHPEVVWHESVRLGDHEITTIDRIPTTSPTRTILDLGAVVDDEEFLDALDDALRRDLTSTVWLDHALERWGSQRRGSGRVRRCLTLRRGSPVPESVLETEFDALIRRFSLPTPSRQWVVRDGKGDAVARVDFAYPVARIAIEIDGLRWHGSLPDRERDRLRQDKIERLNWTVLRFSARDVRRRPEWVRDRIVEALDPEPASLDPVFQGERRNQ